jgi:hypothetical protein
MSEGQDLEKGKLNIKTVIAIVVVVVAAATTILLADSRAAEGIEALDKRVTALENTSKISSDALIRIDTNLQILVPNYQSIKK